MDRHTLLPLMRALRGSGHLWHRTSPARLRQIIRHGAIEPNLGQFKVTYPQSDASLGRHWTAVSLFDFDNEPLREILHEAWKWAHFLIDQGPATVLICLNRRELEPSKLFVPSSLRYGEIPEVSTTEGDLVTPVFIPAVEALFKGPIPTSVFHSYLVVLEEFQFFRVGFGPEAISEIERIEMQQARTKQRRLDRDRAKHGPSLEELIAMSYTLPTV